MQDKMRLSAAVLAAGSTLLTATTVEAGKGPIVRGAKVRHGSAKFDRHGNALRITTGRNTIIDYSQFDIPVGSSVEFMQQNANSRVLNRINSAAPTQIMGSLQSNGRVYFINRAGVVFGKDARIDVNGLFAAAGKMSNQDFLAGRDRVTDMRGTVRNEGSIRAVGEVVLAGRTVVNTGTIETGQGGLVAMVAGESVTLRRAGSNVGVQVAGGTRALGQGGIVQKGTVRAPGGRIVATAGDLASLAIVLDGTVVATAIDVDGGRTGSVRVAGTLDSSGESNGRSRGGQVRVTAGSIEVASGASIDANGPRGGGTVHVGGGVQGGDANMRNAMHLRVADGATVSADATVQGDGGTIAFWSDRRTDFLGSASARGAGTNGAGGFIEASGKIDLLYDGAVNLLGSNGGANGTLLLDPTFLLVLNTSAGVNTIGMSAVNAALAVGNLVIQNTPATQDFGIKWLASTAISGLNTSSLKLDAIGPGAGVEIGVAPSFGTWTGDFLVSTKSGPITVGASINRPLGGNISMSAGGGNSIALNNATVTSLNSSILFNSPVTLGTNVTVNAGTGPVLFGSTVMGTGGNRNLTVNSLGATSFLGSLSSIGRLVTNVGGTTTFGGDIGVSGNMAVNDSAIFLAGAHALTNTGGSTTFFGGTVNGPGSLSITQGTGAVTFGDNFQSVSGLSGLSVNSTGAVTFDGAVDGAMALSIDTTKVTTFTGALGSLVPLNSIDVLTGLTRFNGGTVSTSGDQSYKQVQLQSNTTIDAANLTIAGALGRSGAGTRDFAVNSPGVFTLMGETKNLRNFTTDAGGTFVLGAPMTISGLLSINDALHLNAPLVTLTANGGIDLMTVVGGGNSLTLNSTSTRNLLGDLSGLGDFTTSATGSLVLGGDIAASGDVNIQTILMLAGLGQTRTISTAGAGNIYFKKAVTGPATLDVSGGVGSDIAFGGPIGTGVALGGLNINTGGTVSFTGAVNGAMDLVVNAGGLTSLNSAFGQTTALNSISVTGPVLIAKTGLLTTTGSQNYGDTSLAVNANLTSLGGGAINFNGTVDGAYDLTATSAGVTTFNGLVGDSTALRKITVANGMAFNGASIETTDDQSYGNAMLGSNVAITAGAGDVDFNGTVDGAHNLAVTTTGMTTLAGAVGSGTALTSLTIANDAALNGGAVTTTGAQGYLGNSVLGSDTTLSSTGGSDIVFGGTLNGSQALAVNTSGTTRFDGAVGGGTALTQLAVNGPVAINGGSVTTSGYQVLGNATLGAATNLTSTGGGDIALQAVAGGGNSLGVHTSGTTTLAGDLSGLSSLLVDGGGTTTLGGNVSATGDVALMDDVMLTLGAHGVNSSLGDVIFGAALDGPGSLTAGSAGSTQFAGPVGSGTALAALLVNGTSTFGGGSVQTAGDLNLAGPSTFTADTTLSSGGVLTLGGNANAGAFDLMVLGSLVRFAGGTSIAGNNLSFTGPMSGLGDLTFNSAGTLSLLGDLDVLSGQLELGTPGLLVLGGSIDSLHTLLFHSDIRVQGSRSVTVRGLSDAIFEGTVNGTTFEGDSLVVNSSGLTAFQKDVGNSMRMLRLETNPPGTIQVAPFANAVIVIYGELGPFGPTDGNGGVALAQSYSAMWEEAVRPFIEGRKTGQVDYRRALNTLLTADLDAGLAPGGFAATTPDEE